MFDLEDMKMVFKEAAPTTPEVVDYVKSMCYAFAKAGMLIYVWDGQYMTSKSVFIPNQRQVAEVVFQLRDEGFEVKADKLINQHTGQRYLVISGWDKDE